MQFGNAVVSILLFRLGIHSRDYVPKRWLFGGVRIMGRQGNPATAPELPVSQEIPLCLACRRMIGLDGGIMANRDRAIRPSFRTLIADGDPLFLATFPRSRWPGDGVPKKGGHRSIRSRD